jgi:hypothetical protein
VLYPKLQKTQKHFLTHGFATATEVMSELDLNKGWTYRAINALAEKNVIHITYTSNPWTANNLSVTTFGMILLDYSERTLKEMAQEERE